MIYNNELKLIDSIKYEKNEFINNKNIIDSFEFKGKSNFPDLVSHDEYFSRIIQAYFVNNDTIMIIYKIPHNINKFIDIWGK